MKFPEDFKEFVELLNKNAVEYLIVGGYAIGFYSRPRFTNDIDVWINNSNINAKKVLTVLDDFGFGNLYITQEDLTSDDKIIQLGNAPLRIDILTNISGLRFTEAYKHKESGEYLGVKTYFISIDDLIKNKKSTARKKDLDDIEWLKKYKNKKQ